MPGRVRYASAGKSARPIFLVPAGARKDNRERALRRPILLALWLVGGIIAFPVARPAHADCQPNPPANGSTVTCSGPAPTTVPINAPAATDVTVTINPDAQLTGTGTLIRLGADALITNNGRIQVVSSGSGAAGVIAGAGTVLRNFGTIATTGFNALSAASIGDRAQLVNEEGGQITISGDLAAGLLIGGGNNSTLINAGRITLNTFQGGGLFAEEGNGHVLINATTGVIESTLDEAFGMNGQRGLSAGSGNDFQLINQGTIVTNGQASHGMQLSELTNSSAVNSGSITTSGGSSETVNRAFGMFSFNGQGNVLLNTASGVINASGLGSSGMEMLDGSGNLLRNEGTVNINGAGAHGAYIVSGADNTLDNRGTLHITGQRGNGLRADDGNNTLLNSGSILVQGSDAFGVFMQGSGNTLTNSGVIHATGANADGILSNTVAGSFTVTIDNTGSVISEHRFAVRGVNGQETLINSGSIQSGAGTAIDLRAGSDLLILRTGSQIVGLADGGAGTDGVVLEGTGTATNDFQNFETLRMTGSDWRWSGSGTFGDTRVESGVLRVDGTLISPVTVNAGTTLQVGLGGQSGTVVGNIVDNGTLAGTGTVFGDVQNSGIVSPGNSIGALTVIGNYIGQGGTLLTEAELGDDASPADRLVIGVGSATGLTPIEVVNVGGTGALTTGSGILVVEAVNGGTTGADAFTLAAPVAAGPYEYVLFRGGVSAGTAENWYLRSTSQTVPLPPTGVPVVPEPQPAPGAPPVPLFRPEVAVQVSVPGIAAELGLVTLGTFHDRQGGQQFLRGAGPFKATWGRVFGQSLEQGWTGVVSPKFDGSLWGLQTGLDLFGSERPSGHSDRLGIFFGHAEARGDVSGFALGRPDLTVGRVDLDSNSLGAYWTHIGPSAWYVDGVLMHTWFDGDPRSDRGVGTNTDGTAVTLSLEAGYPINLGGGWTVEPQAQLIWQHLSLGDAQDRFSTIHYDDSDGFTGRIGLRLENALQSGNIKWRPWLQTNLWGGWSGTDAVVFATTPIATDRDTALLEIDAGALIEITQSVGIHASVGYTTDVGDGYRSAVDGNIGLRVTW